MASVIDHVKMVVNLAPEVFRHPQFLLNAASTSQGFDDELVKVKWGSRWHQLPGCRLVPDGSPKLEGDLILVLNEIVLPLKLGDQVLNCIHLSLCSELPLIP